MKVKSSDIKMLLILFGFLAAVASHFLVNTPNTEEIALLEVELEQKTTEKARLKGVEAILPQMIDEISEYQKIVENELQKYPEEVLFEDFTMFADDMRNQLGVTLSTVDISNPALMSKLEIMRKVEETDVSMTVASYLTTLSIAWEFGYAQLKSFIEYVNADSERTVVNSVNMTYNSGTGLLSGQAIVNKYYIVTPNYVYNPTDIPLGPVGNDNPFGTIS